MPTLLTLPTLPLLPTPTTMLLLLLMPLLLLLLPSCDAGLLFKHASVPQVVSSVKAEYPPVGNYHFNKGVSALELYLCCVWVSSLNRTAAAAAAAAAAAEKTTASTSPSRLWIQSYPG